MYAIVLSKSPRPAFCHSHLHYSKAGKAWHLFSHEHDKIYGKRFQNERANILHMVQPTTSAMLGVIDSNPLLALARYVC